MQNAYASPGGYLDLAGFDIAGAAAVIEQDRPGRSRRRGGPACRWCSSRTAGTRTTSRPAGRARPTGGSPMRSRPCASGPNSREPCWPRGPGTTPWSSALQPQPGDIVIEKPRYTAFYNTAWTPCCARAGIRNLAFCGIATNVCVEIDPARRLLPASTSACCWRTPPTRPARPSCRRPRSTTSRTSSAGCRTPPISAGRSARPRPQLISHRGGARMPKTVILPPGTQKADRPVLARHPGRRRGLCLGHAGLRQGQQRRPRRRRRGPDARRCWRPSSR